MCASNHTTSMHLERNRFLTFDNWPTGTIDKGRVAKAGLYFIGNYDRVKCFACHIEISLWNKVDSAFLRHKSFSPFCPFVIGDSNNIPMVNLTRNEPMLTSSIVKPNESPPIYFNFDFNRVEANRLKTFSGWAHDSIDSQLLAKSGFYFIEPADTLRCAFCMGVISISEMNNEPMAVHKRKFPYCNFVRGKIVGNVPSQIPAIPPKNPRDFNRSDLTCMESGAPTSSQRVDDLNPLSPRLRNLLHSDDSTYYKMIIARIFSKCEFLQSLDCTRSERQEQMDRLPPILREMLFSFSPQMSPSKIKESTQPRDLQPDPSQSSSFNLMPGDFVNITSRNGVQPLPLQIEKDCLKELLEYTIENFKNSMKLPELDAQKNQNVLPELLVCKICLDMQVSVLFMPCKHVVSCKKCSRYLDHCPICRRQIEEHVKIYFG